MVRPCYLVVDTEHGGSISTRKLVIETAKLNVLTAYGSQEAVETLQKFPAVDAAILDAAMRDTPCQELILGLRTLRADLPIVVVGGPAAWTCPGADHYLDTFDPARLLLLLRSLSPQQTEAISARDSELTYSGN